MTSQLVNKLKVISEIMDQCSKEYLDSVFSPIADLPSTCTKAEMISHCFNNELAVYGIQTYTSPDRTMVLINDESMSKVVDFFNGTGIRPYVTEEKLERLKAIQKVSNDNNISIYWDQSGFRRKYYYLKQYGFNGVNLYNLLNLNSANTAAAALSPTGAAGITMAGIVALSWSGSLFLSTVENYIPNTMVRTKAVVCGAKFVTALPVRSVEWTSNQIFGFVENIIIGIPLPTNITEVYKLDVGPKLKDLSKFKTVVIQWLINKLQGQI
jgi:hypothetical protein